MRTSRIWFRNDTLDDPLDSDSDFSFIGERAPEGHGNVISSIIDPEANDLHEDVPRLHAPILDLDEVGAVLVPSSTPGNFHLYLDGVALTDDQYGALLQALYRRRHRQGRHPQAVPGAGCDVRPPAMGSQAAPGWWTRRPGAVLMRCLLCGEPGNHVIVTGTEVACPVAGGVLVHDGIDPEDLGWGFHLETAAADLDADDEAARWLAAYPDTDLPETYEPAPDTEETPFP